MKKKTIVITLIVIAVGVAAYFGYKAYAVKKKAAEVLENPGLAADVQRISESTGRSRQSVAEEMARKILKAA